MQTGGEFDSKLMSGNARRNVKKLSLADFLDEQVFAGDAGVEISPTEEDVAGWVRSLQLRGITLPDNLKDEVFLVVGELRANPHKK